MVLNFLSLCLALGLFISYSPFSKVRHIIYMLALEQIDLKFKNSTFLAFDHCAFLVYIFRSTQKNKRINLAHGVQYEINHRVV